MKRCSWVNEDKLMQQYHDEEWGVRVNDDNKLFELLTLEGAQAGLSWKTILHKREGYRAAFDNFDIAKISNYDPKKVSELQNNSAIIRNKLKIDSVIVNAKKFIEIKREFGSFSIYFWSFSDNLTIKNTSVEHTDKFSTLTELSQQISKDLIRRGFKFVGATIIYAFMQAAGMINDHQVDCFRYDEV